MQRLRGTVGAALNAPRLRRENEYNARGRQAVSDTEAFERMAGYYDKDAMNPKMFQRNAVMQATGQTIPIPPKASEIIQEQVGGNRQALESIEPQTPGMEVYRKDMEMNPDLFDVIMNAQIPGDPDEQVGGMRAEDYIRRMVMNLAARESSGGKNLSGDSGNAFGPYHINQLYRKDITPDEAMDFEKATEYVLKEINRNRKSGKNYDQWLRSWNSKSGYVNDAPRYDVEMPRMATSSAFTRK